MVARHCVRCGGGVDCRGAASRIRGSRQDHHRLTLTTTPLSDARWSDDGLMSLLSM